MEHMSCSPTQSEAYCSEPEIMEVLLRSKTTGARTVRKRGIELRSDRARGRPTRTDTAPLTKITHDRLLCERCMCPSRLWLHHTCRVAKPAGGADQNFRFTAVKSKARDGPQATAKILAQKRMNASTAATLSSLHSATFRCNSGERPDTDKRESAACRLQHILQSTSKRADAEALALGQVKSHRLRGSKSPSAQNCDEYTHLACDETDPQFAHMEKPSQRSDKPAFASSKVHKCDGSGVQNPGSHRLRSSCAYVADGKCESAVENGGCVSCSKVLQKHQSTLRQNSAQGSLVMTQTKDDLRFARNFLDASPSARQCSSAGRGVEDKEAATRDELTKSEGYGGRIQAGWHTLPLRRCSCSAAEDVQDIRQELALAVADKKRQDQQGGREEDFGAYIKEGHWQTGVEVGTWTNTLTLTRRSPLRRRHTVHSLVGTAARDHNKMMSEKAGTATWSKGTSWKQRDIHWNMWEAENISVITASVEDSNALKVSAASRVDEQELPLSRRRLHGASPCRCEQLSEGRQTQCSEGSFMTNKTSGVATTNGTYSREDIHGMECFSSNIATHSASALRQGSCPDNYHFFGHFGKQVNTAVQSASGAEISHGAKKCEAATCCCWDGAAQVNRDSPCSNRDGPEKEWLGAPQTRDGACFAEKRRKWGDQGVRSRSASGQLTHSCSGAILGDRTEQQEPLTGTQNESDRTKGSEFVARNCEEIKTQLDCICERVGQFLDTVECFLQESDPQLRREKLYCMHAVFVSVRTG